MVVSTRLLSIGSPIASPAAFVPACAPTARQGLLPAAISPAGDPRVQPHTVWSSLVQCRASRDYRRRRTSASDGIPGISALQDLWRRRLFASAVIIVTLVVVFCMQGISKYNALQEFNSRIGKWYGLTLPSSGVIEGWLFGTQPSVIIRGRRIYPAVGSLEADFIMDAGLVSLRGQVHRLLSANFLHGGIMHLLSNIGFLYTIAPSETGARGTYVTTYLLAGIGGSLAFLRYGGGGRSLGASGALCGLLGYELVAALRQQNVRGRNLVLKQAFGIAVMGLLLPGVDNWSHLGGFCSGIIISFLIARRSGSRRALVPWPLLLAILAIVPAGSRFILATFKALWLGLSSPGALARGAQYV